MIARSAYAKPPQVTHQAALARLRVRAAPSGDPGPAALLKQGGGERWMGGHRTTMRGNAGVGVAVAEEDAGGGRGAWPGRETRGASSPVAPGGLLPNP
jgi:hypothetical protein